MTCSNSTVVNHYYGSCCKCSEDNDQGTDSAATFPWFGSRTPLAFGGTANAPATLSFSQAANNRPNSTSLKSYQALDPLHRPARLIDLSFVKLPGTNASQQIDLNVIVFDFQANILRTISTAPIDFIAAPTKTWIPIPLTTTLADLDIGVDEGVACQLQFSSAPSSNSRFYYQLTGTGAFV